MGGMKSQLGDRPYVPRSAEQLSRASDPHTSFEAGAAVVGKLNEIQRMVLGVLQRAEPLGLTDLELEQRIGSTAVSTYRTRRAELASRGLVVDSGARRIINGRKRIVWRVSSGA